MFITREEIVEYIEAKSAILAELQKQILACESDIRVATDFVALIDRKAMAQAETECEGEELAEGETQTIEQTI